MLNNDRIWQVQHNPFHDQLVISAGSDGLIVLDNIVNHSSYLNSSIQEEDNAEKEPQTVGLVQVYPDHEDSVYSVSWSKSDPWIFGSVSYDGKFALNFVPKEEKYKIIL